MGRRDARYLSVDERMVMQVRRHPWVLARAGLETVGAVVGAVLIGYVLSPDEGSDLVDTLVGLVAIGFFVRFVGRLWGWWDNRILITTQRVVEVSGVLTRRVASMPLSKVTDMTYRRTVFGRLLGFGDLVLESAGQVQALSQIDHIPDPDRFYRTVTALITGGSAGVGGRAPAEEPEPEETADEDDTGPLPRVIV